MLLSLSSALYKLLKKICHCPKWLIQTSSHPASIKDSIKKSLLSTLTCGPITFLKRDMALYLYPIDQKPLVCPHLDAKEAGNIFIRFIWTLKNYMLRY